jgi:hypothetical protein
MIDIRINYQTSIFVNAEDISPTPDIITSLIKAFRDKALIPNTFQELSASSPAPQVRLRLSTSDAEWGIDFGTRRIDIEKHPTDPKGSNLGELADFCLNSSDFLERILRMFKKRANRLSLVTDSLLKEMSDAQLAKVYVKLFNPPHFYRENPPSEWNYRSVARIPVQIEDLTDTLNVITRLNRIQGGMSDKGVTTRFDRLQLALDINTVPQNTEYRFELSHINAFYQSALALHSSLSEQILEHINV